MFRIDVVIPALLLVFGLLWCKEIFKRFGSDLSELRSSEDNMKKGTILLFWGITAVIVFFIVSFLWGLLRNLIGAFE